MFQYRDKLLRKFANKWETLAAKEANSIRNLDTDQIQSIAKG